MVKGTVRFLALSAMACVAITACGSKPATSSSTTSSGGASGGAAAGTGLKACMVLDVGGVDDRSFNESSGKGMTDAKASNGARDISYVSSSSQNDYVPNLSAEVSKGCQTTIAVGGLMTDAMKSIAGKNPSK